MFEAAPQQSGKRSFAPSPSWQVAAVASGVAKLVNIFKAGDITASQWDILFDARDLGVDYY